MRRRKIKGALERYKGYTEYALPEGEGLSKALNDFLAGPCQWRGLEIGSGRGDFLVGMAKLNNQGKFLGIEMKEELLMRTAHKLESEGIHNVKLLLADASSCFDLFPKGVFNGIYLNFSDPWPKDRHAKRRLSHSRYLEAYRHMLAPEGQIVLKTDNRELFLYSLDSLREAEYDMIEVVEDLTALADPMNVVTEYEAKFSALGYPIYRVIAKPKSR